MDKKFGLPVSLPEICSPRTELLRVLDHAAERQIVYIQAPGGHGKTVAMLLWLKKTGGLTAWHGYDEYDNTPALFYLVFCRSLLSVVPQDEDIASLVNAPGFRDAPVEFTVELLTKTDFGQERIVLVLDDFHTINNPSVLKSLPYVLKRLPDNVTVFILSRGELPETFDVLQNVNRVSMVETRALAFSADEIMKHLASYGRFTTEREAEAIREYSEGWIILINSMAVSGNLEMDEKKSRLSYKTFFERNVWNGMNEERREFLMKSAVPDDFTAELCGMLTGAENCKEHIDLLIQGNANISVSNGVYRYHDLFRDFLLEQLDKSQIDKAELHKKTAQYYFAKNDYLTARRYALRSDDFAVIAESTKKFAEDKNISLDEYVEFSRIFHENELPDAVCDKLPFLYIPKGLFYFLVGNAQKFNYCMDKLQAAIPIIAKNFPPMLESALTCSTMDYRIKTSELLSFSRSLPSVTYVNETQQANTSSFHLPFLHRSARDFYELIDYELFTTLVEEVWRSHLKENIDCFHYNLLAGLCIEKNKLSEASDAYLKARNALNGNVSHEIGYAVFLGLAEVSLLKRNADAYALHLNEAKEYVETNGAHYLKRNLWAYEARRGLSDGDKNTAEQWLSNYFVIHSGFETLYMIYQNFTTARAYIVLGRLDEALDALRIIKSMADSFDRLLDAAEADVLMSVIHWISGNKKEAADLLYGRLLILQPYGFIRIAANEGKAILPILSAAMRKLDKAGDTDTEVYRFVKDVYLMAYEQSKHYKGITNALEPKAVKLSRQQTLILEHLAQGHKNAQIVELAGISLNTVRSHTKILYQKLEVTNAMDAIVRARQLGLLK